MTVRLTDKGKVFVITIIAATVMLVAGIAVTAGLLLSDRDKEVLAYVSGNFGEIVSSHIAETEMSPVLSTMLSDVGSVSATYIENKAAVNVSFTLPEFDKFREVERIGVYPDKHDEQSIEPFQFISDFEKGYLDISRTPHTRSYSVNLPISANRFNIELDLYSRELYTIIDSYCNEFSFKLDDLINKTNLEGALEAYFFSDVTGADGGENAQPDLQQRLKPFLSPAKVNFKVGEYGIFYMELERYESSGLIGYALGEQLKAYEGVFLTEPVTGEDMETEFLWRMNVCANSLRLDNRSFHEAETEDIPVKVRKEKIPLDLGSIAAAGENAKASFLPGVTSYLYEYGGAISELNAKAETLLIHIPQSEPMSDVLSGSVSGLPLRIENTPGFGACFIEFIATPEDVPAEVTLSSPDLYSTDGYLAVFIRDGENFEVKLPAGMYRIEYSFGSGNSWYGAQYLFGPDGRYSQSADVVTLDSGAYILTLNTEKDRGEAIAEIPVPYSSRVSMGAGDDTVSLSLGADAARINDADALAGGTSARLQKITVSRPSTRTLEPSPETGGENLPYLIYVSKDSFTIAILGLDDAGEYSQLLYTFSTAVGRTNAMTRPGNYTIVSRERWHTWTSGNVSPFATRHSGKLYFHGPLYTARDSNKMKVETYNEIGTRATSGCMRTYTSAAAWIYYNCPNGTPVIIANDSKYTSAGIEPLDPSQNYDPTDPDAVTE